MPDVMIGIKVRRINAEKARKYLTKHTLLDNKHKVMSRNSFIYFPVRNMNNNTSTFLQDKLGGKIVRITFDTQNDMKSYKTLLKKALGDDYENAPRGFESIGNIAIIDSNAKIAKKIGSVIMEMNKNISTVIRKEGAVKGRYRKRKYKHVIGKRRFVTEYKENGATMKFDIRDTFFSTRLSFERSRIAALSKGKENVVVMFAGVGPFAIELALKNKEANVVGIEINRKAARYMKENIELNKTKNVVAVSGDVKKVAKNYPDFADRIIMPLPKDAGSFLDSVVIMAKKKCIVHYYAFVDIDGGVEDLVEKLKAFFSSRKMRFEVIMWRTVRPYSPKTIEIVIDFKVARERY